jgi:hypothetical protein
LLTRLPEADLRRAKPGVSDHLRPWPRADRRSVPRPAVRYVGGHDADQERTDRYDEMAEQTAEKAHGPHVTEVGDDKIDESPNALIERDVADESGRGQERIGQQPPQGFPPATLPHLPMSERTALGLDVAKPMFF